MKKIILCFVLLTSSFVARSDEGMWMLSHLSSESMNVMRSLGLEMSRKELFNTKGTSLKDAVVCFGGFCTGVIVSPNGLVFTNHHCGFDEIQSLSTTESDFLTNGFVSQSFADELPAKGLYVRILKRTDDVSKRVEKAIEKYYKKHKTAVDTMDVAACELIRRSCVDSVCTVIENEYARRYPDLFSEVSPYYEGNVYYVNVYEQYDDIRLVFAPPQSLGKFGGDTDNWMWPRQTCDFSVFRIYVDKDNHPAEYSLENKPFQPTRYAEISLDGFDKGDYCMTVGYPGRTNRYLSSYGIQERVYGSNAARINVRGEKQRVWKRWMDKDPAIRLQYASKYANSSNYWKNSIGMNKAIADLKVVEQKQEQEQSISDWIANDSRLSLRFGNVLSDLSTAYDARKGGARAIAYINESFLAGPDLLRIAYYFTRFCEAEDSSLKEQWSDRIRQQYKDWNTDVDRETMTTLIRNYREQVAQEYLPSIYTIIDTLYNGDIAAYVDTLFSQTFLLDTTCLYKELSEEQIDSDPAMQCNRTVRDFSDSIYDDISKYNRVIAACERKLCQARLEMDYDQPHYSDANSTLRVSYGFVEDYTGASGYQTYFTTMSSLLDKVSQGDSISDYRVESDIVTMLKADNFDPYRDKRSGEMNLCFLTNNDITGGNSGSPMFDGCGRLLGLAFDGNWDAMSGDISFTQELSRCIAVDIRYVLYVIDRIGRAERLIHEVGL